MHHRFFCNMYESCIYIYFCQGINSLPNYKILDMIKLKAFADEKLNVLIFDREANTVGKGENAGYQHFLLFLQCFPKPSSSGSLKVRIMW